MTQFHTVYAFIFFNKKKEALNIDLFKLEKHINKKPKF